MKRTFSVVRKSDRTVVAEGVTFDDDHTVVRYISHPGETTVSWNDYEIALRELTRSGNHAVITHPLQPGSAHRPHPFID